MKEEEKLNEKIEKAIIKELKTAEQAGLIVKKERKTVDFKSISYISILQITKKGGKTRAFEGKCRVETKEDENTSLDKYYGLNGEVDITFKIDENGEREVESVQIVNNTVFIIEQNYY